VSETHFVMGIDVGTTAVKVAAMSEQGDIAASSSVTYGTVSPKPGWVEQDPDVWWHATVEAVRACLQSIPARRIEAVSFSGHMSATVLIGNDGAPVMPSILIADARSSEETNWLRRTMMPRLLEMTGNEPLDAFSLPKILWIKRHLPDALRQPRARLSAFFDRKRHAAFRCQGQGVVARAVDRPEHRPAAAFRHGGRGLQHSRERGRFRA